MSVNFRPTTENDAHYLLDIDLKCYDTALTPDEWRELQKSAQGAVATWCETPIGMIISRRTEEGDVEVMRVAVKAPWRNIGIGKRLMLNAVAHARDIGSTRCFVIIPESQIDPGKPHDLSGWLFKLGFRAEVPLLKDHFVSCGQLEDGVVFSFQVPLS